MVTMKNSYHLEELIRARRSEKISERCRVMTQDKAISTDKTSDFFFTPVENEIWFNDVPQKRRI